MSFLKVSIRDDFTSALMKKLDIAGPRAAHALAIQIAKDTEDYVPALTKSLSNRTQVDDGRIIYPGPYARYLYYGKVMVDAQTGKGPMRIVGEDGSVILRFRKGAKLRPTEKPLKIKQDVHAHAQSHWFEGAKGQNMEKWERVGGKLIEYYLTK